MLAAFIGGCTGRNPLDMPVQPPTPINGSISVTVYSGTTPYPGGVSVTATSFDGTTKTAFTPTQAAMGIQVGQVVFTEPKAGIYKVSIFGQPASSPNVVSVTLSPDTPNKNVNLQLTGATLSISPSDGNTQNYGLANGVHSYTILYTNASNYQEDIQLFMTTGLPMGWNSSFSTTALHPGQASTFYVYNPSNFCPSGVSISVSAYVAATAVTSATLYLSRAWSVNVQLGLEAGVYAGTPFHTSAFVTGDPGPNVNGTGTFSAFAVTLSGSAGTGSCGGHPYVVSNLGIPSSVTDTPAPGNWGSGYGPAFCGTAILSVSGNPVLTIPVSVLCPGGANYNGQWYYFNLGQF